MPFFYTVEDPVNKYGEGKPTILSLKDYNGDGDALEFALFEAESCMRVKTSLFGYSKPRDRVIQYPIHLIQREGASVTVRDSPWLDHFMLQKPVRPGYWKWQIQYHVGGLTHYEIHYDRIREMFEGEVIIDEQLASARPYRKLADRPSNRASLPQPLRYVLAAPLSRIRSIGCIQGSSDPTAR